jgi:hypothetical protein
MVQWQEEVLCSSRKLLRHIHLLQSQMLLLTGAQRSIAWDTVLHSSEEDHRMGMVQFLLACAKAPVNRGVSLN